MVAAGCELLGLTDARYFRWCKEYGGIKVDQAKRLKALQEANARLNRLLADAELDKAILRETAKANFGARRAAGLRSRKSGARCPR
jgi:putative transposase